MFEKFCLLLKNLPFPTAAARLVIGDEIAIGTSLGVSPPILRLGNLFFEVSGYHMLQPFSIFGARCMLWVPGCPHGTSESCPNARVRAGDSRVVR